MTWEVMMKKVHYELPSLLDAGRAWSSWTLAVVAATWRIVILPVSAAVCLGAWVINACVWLALAMLGLLVGGFLVCGVGYVIFYPLIVR
jgi:hypothetical protein